MLFIYTVCMVQGWGSLKLVAVMSTVQPSVARNTPLLYTIKFQHLWAFTIISWLMFDDWLVVIAIKLTLSSC